MITFNPANFHSFSYEEQFSDLLVISDTANLLEIASKAYEKKFLFDHDRPPALSERKWTAEGEKIRERAEMPPEKIVRKKIDEWSNRIAESLQSARRRPENLIQLQSIFTKFVEESKLTVLFNLLVDNKINTPKMQAPFERLEKIIQELLATPPIESSDKAYVIFKGERPNISPAVNKVIQCKPESSPEWVTEMARQFKTLSSNEEIVTVAEMVGNQQAMHLIQRLLFDKENEWRLCFLIGALPSHTLEKLALHFDDASLILLNKVFHASEEGTKQWLIHQIDEKHKNNFIARCNALVGAIDNLAKEFRDDPKGDKMTRDQIQSINHITKVLRKRQEAIRKLSMLLEGFFQHPETKHVIFKGIRKEYDSLLVRLTETKKYPNRPPGCIWPIIYRNVFKRIGLKDHNDANEIFSDWGMETMEQHDEAYLFGELDPVKYEALKALLTTKEALTGLVKEILKALNITKISDWKEQQIFNKNMLKEFLSRRDNKETIEAVIIQTLNTPAATARVS